MRYIELQLESRFASSVLCTSLANARDLGEWIGATSHGLFNFARGGRPVPLEIRVTASTSSTSRRVCRPWPRPVYGAICQHAPSGEPSIVFVPTRKHAKLASLDLLTFAAAEGSPKSSSRVTPEDLAPHIDKISDPAVRHALRFRRRASSRVHGREERELVERVFASARRLFSWSPRPLAWGLTASCKLSVIMGTQYYDAGGAGPPTIPSPIFCR